MSAESFQLHPEAQEAFDKRLLRLREALPAPDDVDRWVLPLRSGSQYQVDPDTGEVRAIEVRDHGRTLVIEGEHFEELQRIATRLRRSAKATDSVSLDALRGEIVSWLQRSLQGIRTDSPSRDVLTRVASRIRWFQSIIPVWHLNISQPFEVGHVEFVPGDPVMFQEWIEEIPEAEHASRRLRRFLDRESETIEGHAVARIKLRAEENRAYELALRRVEEAVEMLTVFSPATLAAAERCEVGVRAPFGPTSYFCMLLDEGVPAHTLEELSGKRSPTWVFGAEELSEARELGLDAMGHLLRRRDRTDFQEHVLRAYHLYARVARTSIPEEKLVHALTGMEYMLLRDQQEPIQGNLARRVAFVVAEEGPKRRDVVKAIKDAYRLRSRWLHHAMTTDDRESVTAFLLVAWVFFRMLAQIHGAYQKREQFILHLDALALDGPSVEAALRVRDAAPP